MLEDVITGTLVRNGSRYVRLTEAEFYALPDYSCTLPTGTTIGKRWRRREPYEIGPEIENVWYMGEYVECDDPGKVGIEWSLIEILSKREAQIVHVYPNGIDGKGRHGA